MTDRADAKERLLQMLPVLMEAGPRMPPPDEIGISRAQVALLAWVADSPGCSLQELAGGLSLTAPTVSVGVRRLEEAGLLARVPDPEDGRAWQLHLTREGVALLDRVHRYRRDKVRRMLAGLTPEEQVQLVNLLEKALRTAEVEPD